MAIQMEGVTAKLLSCATNEFLAKGYKDASLREIAENAGTSTSPIYTRFGGKQGLFNAIVQSVADQFEQTFKRELVQFDSLSPMQWNKMLEYTTGKQGVLTDLLYDNFPAFKLLVCHAEGTIFSNFIHSIVSIDVAYTTKYFAEIGNDALACKRLSPALLHMLCSAYWTGVFEVVVHDMEKSDAQRYIQQLNRFFHYGWRDIFSPT